MHLGRVLAGRSPPLQFCIDRNGKPDTNEVSPQTDEVYCHTQMAFVALARVSEIDRLRPPNGRP
jgi:hypothetical protein